MRKIRTTLVNPLNRDRLEILGDHVISCQAGVISEKRPYDPALDSDCEDRRDCVLLPGLIDVHTHLSQYRIRGLFEPALFPWLDKHVYPAEARSSDPAYARGIAEEFFAALFAAGTTTSVIFTAPFEVSCQKAFEAASQMGARAYIGMSLMDQNCPGQLRQDTDNAIALSKDLFQRFDTASPLLRYILTPRFAVSCSSRLLSWVGSFAADNAAWIQTHLSENEEEVSFVRGAFKTGTYTQVYQERGLLTPRSIFAHAIHLGEAEMGILASHRCKLAYCPDSNFFLKSGEFPYRDISLHGIDIGIGSDVAAGTTPNMLYHAKMANFRQSSHPLLPARLIWHLTLGNAALLGLEDRIGSLERGKEADFILLNLPKPLDGENDLASELCFCGHEYQLRETVIAGRTVFLSSGLSSPRHHGLT